MSREALENLARVGSLKAEAVSTAEARRMLEMARSRLVDAGLEGMSIEGRFMSAYGAAYAAALAALWMHGFRSENRFVVFQCLTHTVGWPASRWRVLDTAHRLRNLAEYEGFAEFDSAAVEELRTLVRGLILEVERLLP